MRHARHVLLLMLLVPALLFGEAPRTYSDVHTVAESGDVVGTELILAIDGQRVTGTLRHYEGAEPEPIDLTGRLVDGALRLCGSYAEGQVRITGRLTEDRLIGKLSFRSAKQTNDVALDLPR